MKFLSSNKTTLDNFSPDEQNNLLEILTRTNSLTSGDVKSPRAKALIKYNQMQAPTLSAGPAASLEFTPELSSKLLSVRRVSATGKSLQKSFQKVSA